MKLKRFGELNEGTWSTPKDIEQGQKYIDKLKKLQDEIYDVFGDDEVMNGLDAAIKRMKELNKK